MPHVTFVHGILNKPPADELLNSWNQYLASEAGIDLGANGVTSSMVYWADVMYASPETAGSHESTDELPGGPASDVAFSWMADADAEERSFVNRVAAELDRNMAAVPAPTVPPPVGAVAEGPGLGYERVPVPWFIKRRVLEAFLRDVHHYLFNSKSTPRPGVSFDVQDEIRGRFLKDLEDNKPSEGKHIVVSHSMGTVIAYDCLKRVPECRPIDALVTLGSPLGIDEVRDLLRPGWTPRSRIKAGWSADDAFPSEKVRGYWINVFDRLDPVDATAPELAGYFRKRGASFVFDVAVSNPGWSRHDLNKYFAQPTVRQHIASFLGLDRGIS